MEQRLRAPEAAQRRFFLDTVREKNNRRKDMTQHPSLKGGQEGAKFRSVLKRHERIKELTDKDKWDEEKDSIYHLPKLKRIKFKVKKSKGPAEEKTEAEGAEAAAAEPQAGGAKKEQPKK